MAVEGIAIYVGISLVLGAIVAWITLWLHGEDPSEHPRRDALKAALFVAVLWPVVVIGALL